MGYDVHITRKELWWEEAGPSITVEEWRAYVAADTQLQLIPGDEYRARLAIQSTCREPWLKWHEGNIYTKDPDEWIIAKMILIAAALNARVQGDEGKFYSRSVYQDYINILGSRQER